MEPWFEWSWIPGIKPIHSNGWLFAGVFWIIEAPLLFATVGAFGLNPVLQILAGAAFLLFAIGGFAFTFSKFRD